MAPVRYSSLTRLRRWTISIKLDVYQWQPWAAERLESLVATMPVSQATRYLAKRAVSTARCKTGVFPRRAIGDLGRFKWQSARS